MSWTRAGLKERAKAAFTKNYWKCLIVALILTLVTSNGSSNGRDDNKKDKVSVPSITWSSEDNLSVGNFLQDQVGGRVENVKNSFSFLEALLGIGIAMVVLVVAVIAFFFKELICNPIIVGGDRFFVLNSSNPHTGVKEIISSFGNGYYGNAVVAMFLRDLYTFLWTLLLVIPGIIKSYEYRMVPYLLAEHPELTYKEVFDMSRNMMDGQKMNAFVLDLSFIGWGILSVITGGIVGFFWVKPYIYATDAELYLALSGSGRHYGQTENSNYGNYSGDWSK